MIKLTKQQADLIDHRLGAPDALVEVMGETFGYAMEDVEDAIEDLRLMVARRNVDMNALTPISREVLIDCIEGSVWVACIYDGGTNAEYDAACRVMANIADKLIYAGLNIRVVPYR